MNSSELKARELLEAPEDLFCGDDSTGFYKLRDQMLPIWIQRRDEGDVQAAELLQMVERFSRLCKLMME